MRAVDPEARFEAAMADAINVRHGLAQNYPRFFRCPSGHGLPRRMPHGRCSPYLCASPGEDGGALTATGDELKELDTLPVGAESLAQRPTSAEDAEAMKARNEEALRLHRARAQELARLAFMPGASAPPPLPPMPPPGSSRETVDAWMEQAALDAMPHMMASLMLDARFGSGQTAREARAQLFKLAGYDKNERGQTMQQPVVVLNFNGSPFKQSNNKEANSVTATGNPFLKRG